MSRGTKLSKYSFMRRLSIAPNSINKFYKTTITKRCQEWSLFKKKKGKRGVTTQYSTSTQDLSVTGCSVLKKKKKLKKKINVTQRPLTNEQ